MTKVKKSASTGGLSNSAPPVTQSSAESGKKYGAFAEEIRDISSFVNYAPSPTPVKGKGIGIKVKG
ncbi:hypothetical protein [Emticicia sp. 21SJ11W-3]|uniref:hypothetical protein n=1 Tax=Emticicia sp. 21SJ11W-3 TaxID=2916755 RepID=UPI00209DF350|nr:hypothetical protein [Emticicia sp. 21SJ11W-3]UTA66589.1 hypothetical protein MB380_13360 [Emticicia sp. 21SJ11W-3]